jgi:aerobic-type carbon monoxide dehydrogenase small subunit (CoxS/CutS family)
MTATALAHKGGALSHKETREEIVGVLCRCTGYQSIVTAIERYFAESVERPTDPAERISGGAR